MMNIDNILLLNYQVFQLPLLQFPNYFTTIIKLSCQFIKLLIVINICLIYNNLGYSTISPDSSVPRVYEHAFLNVTEFLPLKPQASLIKGAAYVASDCHKRDNSNARRDERALILRKSGIRVDGLARCL